MRARLVTPDAPPRHEWIIVSRWGAGGGFLSIARTLVAARLGEAAPMQLAPQATALAELLALPPANARPTFLFTQSLPARITVAGAFAPAEGYVRLRGRGVAERLHAEGRCTGCDDLSVWRVEAIRVPWFGEFIEGVTPAGC